MIFQFFLVLGKVSEHKINKACYNLTNAMVIHRFVDIFCPCIIFCTITILIVTMTMQTKLWSCFFAKNVVAENLAYKCLSV